MNKDKSVRLAIDFPKEIVDKLDKEASKLGIKRTQLMRSIVIRHFEDSKNVN